MKPLDLGAFRVWVFGRWREIGSNQVLPETWEGSLLLDFGQPFGRWGAYFTEFPPPRTSGLGLRDLLFLGLLPPVPGLYRDGKADTFLPPELERDLLGGLPLDGGRVLAFLVSHAHLDHAGSVGYLRQDLPVVTTAATPAISKAMQDTAQAGVDGET
ncbi:MBL fold metallo-hydrolase, partial [Shewanella sp. C31]|nr:MBL fold metallo-hydrolase [Shewanella electrica]